MRERFNEIWVQNRFRHRKRMAGTGLRLNEALGYLEPSRMRGFNAEMKDTFIKRFSVCDNLKAIAKSLFIDIQTVYDAIAMDKKFRDEINRCDLIEGRKKQLNNQLVELAASEKKVVLTDLTGKMDKYLK